MVHSKTDDRQHSYYTVSMSDLPLTPGLCGEGCSRHVLEAAAHWALLWALLRDCALLRHHMHPIHEPERGALGAVAHADLLPLGLCRLVNLVLGHLTQLLSPLHAALAAAQAARTLASSSAVREQRVLRVAALVGWQRLRRGELLPGRLVCRAAEVRGPQR